MGTGDRRCLFQCTAYFDNSLLRHGRWSEWHTIYSESSKEERMEILRTTPCPKIVNFLRYGKSVEVSQWLMTSILGLYSDEPLPFVPQTNMELVVTAGMQGINFSGCAVQR